MKKLTIVLLSLFISACNPVKNKMPNTALYQTWLNSHEENRMNPSSNSKIFRPSTFREFPASRFRMKYSFNKNGSCTYSWLSPIDRHERRACTYTFNNGIIQLFDTKKQKLDSLKVLSLSKNKLVIQAQ